MAKYNQMSPQTQQEAMKIARANQKPGQTKAQTQLIAQGIQKGIDEYKKQMKARARQADKHKKLLAKSKQAEPLLEHDEATPDVEWVEVTRQHPLPWLLLLLSWLGFGLWLWLRG